MTSHRTLTLGLLLVATTAWTQPGPPPRPEGPVIVQSRVTAGPGSWIGVGIVEVNAATAKRVGLDRPVGIEIANVAENSPAEDAGLRKGDVVVTFRGEPVVGVEHFARLVRETPVGREVAMQVRSEAGPRDVTVTIGRRETQMSKALESARRWQEGFRRDFPDFDIPRPRMVVRNRSLGAELEGLDGQLAEFFGAEEGVLVRSVDKESAAAKAGLQAGDVVTAVDGRKTSEPGDVRRELGRPDGATRKLEIVRNRKSQVLEIEINVDQGSAERSVPVRARSASSR